MASVMRPGCRSCLVASPAMSEQPAAPEPQPLPDSLPPPPPPPPGARTATVEERKEALRRAIQTEVVNGGRVESQSDFQAVIVTGKPVNNTLHLILTIVTCVIWGLVWLVLALTGGEKRVLISVDEAGDILRQKV